LGRDTANTLSDDERDASVVAILVGWMMVAVLLLAAILQVYEESIMNSFYPATGQFAFLRAIFPSPAYYDLLSWQKIIVLEVVPFMLFFYLAVRMNIDLFKRWSLLPTVLTMAIVGTLLSILESAFSQYQDNLSSLLLTGSWSLPRQLGSESLITFLGNFVSPLGILFLFGAAMQFVFLGVAGIAFGGFVGETPVWALRRWLIPEPEDTLTEAET